MDCYYSSEFDLLLIKLRKSMRKLFLMCRYSEEEREQRRINSMIDKELRRQKHVDRRSIKLLLLGTGESGKSTFIKQMRIIHGEGYNEEDRTQFKSIVIQNILDSIQTILRAMESLDVEMSDPDLKQEIESIRSLNLAKTKFEFIDDEMKSLIGRLWRDAGFQECCGMRNKFQLSDSVDYFLDDLERISALDYIPNEQDVLRVRVPTTGVREYSFEHQSGIFFRFVDVAGQRCERRKWIHCFEEVTSIMFLAALSEYDQILRESDDNRMVESKMLFKTLAESKWFHNSSLILFLNKKDILEEKIQTSDLSDHFPEFTGPKNDAEAAKQFILTLFVKQLSKHRASKVYSFFTCATDTDNIQNVFRAVKDTILIENLISLDLLH